MTRGILSLAVLTGLLLPQLLTAKDDSLGRLIFLGKTSDSSRSVWLSLTNQAGSFELQTQGQQLVDKWRYTGPGRRLTGSPFVSTGSGGTHFLLEVSGSKPVQIDSQNQKGGFVFPPNWPPGPGPGPGPRPGPHPRPDPGPKPVWPGPGPHPGPGPDPGPHPRPDPGPMPIWPGPRPHPGPGPDPGPTPVPPVPPLPPDDVVPRVRPARDFPQSDGSTPRDHDDRGFGESVPLTAGREFGIQPYWNLWADGRYYATSDRRKGLNLDGQGFNLTFGGDRRVGDDVVLGLMLSLQTYQSSAFKDRLTTESEGFTIGPYVSWQVAPRWAVELAIGYGRTANENDLVSLNSEFTTELFTGSLTATGQYDFGSFNVRPRATISYTHFHNEDYAMVGNLGRFHINIPKQGDRFDAGVATVTVEINRVLQTKRGTAFVPYVELGATYEFERPNGGVILTGDLSTASTTPWSGSIRAGGRALLSSAFFVEASAGYLSIGQRDLNLWEGRLFISYAF